MYVTVITKQLPHEVQTVFKYVIGRVNVRASQVRWLIQYPYDLSHAPNPFALKRHHLPNGVAR
jgi:hypothetical protein